MDKDAPGRTWRSRGISEKMHLDCAVNALNRREAALKNPAHPDNLLLHANTVEAYDTARESKLTQR